jgi:hypothetical protein
MKLVISAIPKRIMQTKIPTQVVFEGQFSLIQRLGWYSAKQVKAQSPWLSWKIWEHAVDLRVGVEEVWEMSAVDTGTQESDEVSNDITDAIYPHRRMDVAKIHDQVEGYLWGGFKDAVLVLEK